jgi:hypothetical protein
MLGQTEGELLPSLVAAGFSDSVATPEQSRLGSSSSRRSNVPSFFGESEFLSSRSNPQLLDFVLTSETEQSSSSTKALASLHVGFAVSTQPTDAHDPDRE